MASDCLLQELAFIEDVARRMQVLRRYLRERASPLAALLLSEFEEARGRLAAAAWAQARAFVVREGALLPSDAAHEVFLARVFALPGAAGKSAPRGGMTRSREADLRRARLRAESRPSWVSLQRLGLAYERNGLTADAIRAYQKALSLLTLAEDGAPWAFVRITS